MIYAIGDSFTYGSELADQKSAWPSVLSGMIGEPIINKGRPGSGNTRIVKRAIDVILGDADMVLLGWTNPNRLEFANDQSGEIWDAWPGRELRNVTTADHRASLVKYLTLHDTPEYYYRQWLRQIILIQNLCKANRVKCLMFSACVVAEFNKRYAMQNMDLVQHIDTDLYAGWPNFGAQEWTYGLPNGPGGHPLELGHQRIAEKINEHIRYLGWIS